MYPNPWFSTGNPRFDSSCQKSNGYVNYKVDALITSMTSGFHMPDHLYDWHDKWISYARPLVMRIIQVVEHRKSTCSGRRECRMHQIGSLAYNTSVMAWKSTGPGRPQQACLPGDPHPARPAPGLLVLP